MKKFLPKSANNPQGFTLIELLVVVSIIAVLSIIGLVVFSGAQKNARDAKRKADINAISTVMEKNYVSGSATPYASPSATLDFSDGKLPVDPQTNLDYTLTPGIPINSYVVCALLENDTGGNSSSDKSVNTTGTLKYFCRQNQQ